ncbi:MAG: hypothetical protein AB1705_28420, partial [Verrucomicrobiota bacterium]
IVAGDGLSDERARSVRRAMEEGRTVFVCLKSPAMMPTLAALLNQPSLIITEASGGAYALLGQIDFKHPLFAPFADPRYSDFTKIHFWKHRAVNVDTISNVKVLARFDRGDAALFEVPAGQGNLFVLTSGWQPADSQFALSSKFVPLCYALLEYAGGIKIQSFQYLVGDAVALPLGREAQSANVRLPDGSSKSVEASRRFDQTDLPGVYSEAGGFRFAVNLAPEESRTSAVAVDELERMGVPLKAVEVSAGWQAEQKRHLRNAELEAQQKMWRWLIVAALVVIVMETLVAGWITRRAASQTVVTA